MRNQLGLYTEGQGQQNWLSKWVYPARQLFVFWLVMLILHGVNFIIFNCIIKSVPGFGRQELLNIANAGDKWPDAFGHAMLSLLFSLFNHVSFDHLIGNTQYITLLCFIATFTLRHSKWEMYVIWFLGGALGVVLACFYTPEMGAGSSSCYFAFAGYIALVASYRTRYHFWNVQLSQMLTNPIHFVSNLLQLFWNWGVVCVIFRLLITHFPVLLPTSNNVTTATAAHVGIWVHACSLAAGIVLGAIFGATQVRRS